MATRRFAAALFAVLLAGCAAKTSDIEPGQRPAADTNEAGYWMVADRLERQIKTSGQRIDDERLHAYVNEVACRVSERYCGDLRVYVTRRAGFNAYMLPNGAMVLWSGLLLRMEDEAQLATVIGHEIAHYERRHTYQRRREARIAGNIALVFNVASAMAGVSSAGNLANLIAQGYVAAYSREQESESDALAIRKLSDAGYDVSAAPEIWRDLIAERDAADADAPVPLFATHPPSDERLNAMEEQIAGMADGGPQSRFEDRYLERVLPHRGRWLDQELSRGRWARVEVLLDRLATQGARPGEVAFYRGELHRQRREDGDLQAALAAFQRARSLDGAPVELHRSLGLALWRDGQRKAARDAFERYLDRAGAPADAAMIRSYIEKLGEAT
jgi:Zn-dependent protease with chaperone function